MFEQVDILLDKEMLDFITFLMFHETRRITELKYEALFQALSLAEAGSQPPPQESEDYEEDAF